MHVSSITRATAIAGGVAVLALVAAAGAHAGHCTNISGTFTSSIYYPPPCLSEVGVCQHEVLSGSHLVTGDFTFHTLGTAGDPGDPTRYNYTGSHVFGTHGDSVVFGEDIGVLHIDDTGISPFESTSMISGGTRQYRNATGEIHLTGILDDATGLAAGSYDGTVCT